MKTLAAAAIAFLFAAVTAAWAQDEMPKDPGAKKAAPSAQLPPSGAAPKGDKGQTPGTAEEEAPSVAPPGTMTDQPFAVLQALDKVTARIRRLPVKVGEKAPFGTLSIEVDACRKAPPEDPPEAAAFLKITDARPGEAAQLVFSGWMFASSPALSAMDNPVYDIWVVDCTSDSTASSALAQ